MQQSQAGNIDLVVHGIYGGSPRGFLFTNGQFQPDSLSEAPVSLQTLLDSANTRAELTFVGVPRGEGRMRSIDLNSNGILNDDEPRTSVSISGRVVDANGLGISGVNVTLSGSQAASASTDANGKFIFNFVGIDGTHTVTPAKSGLSFSPANRTFANPTWNKSATFITSATANGSDSSSFFVFQHYNDFLNRDPDTNGLNFWIGEIENCTPKPQCTEVKRVNVSGAFFLSIEFQESGYLVYKTLKASFGNLSGKPIPATFNQLMTDGQRVSRNVVVGVGNWQATLEANKVAFFRGWVQRPEFLAAFPNSLRADQFVDQLNANAGGVLSDSERTTLINSLTTPSDVNQRAQVLRLVAEDKTLHDAELNKAFVLMQYCGYLRRNPDDVGFDGNPDPNFNGFTFWLNKLNEFNGNFVNAEMVKAFITSIEYRQRFGQ
jgi:hypothetical protein